MAVVDGNRVIAFLLQGGRELLLEKFIASSCIASTAAAEEVCRYFGIKARPLAVKVEVFNPTGYQLLKDGVTDQEEFERGGGWIVGVNGSGEMSDHDWDGHLVLLVTDDRGTEVLVDLSADQFSRPVRDIRVAPLAVAVDEWPLCFHDLKGHGFRYEPMTDQDSWRRARDFRYEGRWRPVAGKMIRALKEAP